MSTPTGPGWGPLTNGPAAFSITGPPQVEITAQRQGSAPFTVTNLTGRPLRARLLPRALQGADPAWIAVAGPPELPMAVGATVTVNLAIAVPPTAAGGSYLLRLDAVPEDDTEAEVTGPSVAFVVPPPAVVKTRPKWLIPLLIGVLVLILVAGGLIVFLGRRGAGLATPAPSRTATAAGPAWSEWENLGGTISSGPAVTSWSPDRLDVFARGTNAALGHFWRSGDGPWSAQETLGNGAQIIDAPSAVSWGPNRIDVFVRGTDNALYQYAWTPAGWAGYYPFGGYLTATPAVSSPAENRLDVFVRGGDRTLFQRTWNGAAWSEYESRGGNLEGAPAAISRNDTTIDVFYRGSNNHLYQRTYDGSRWGGFSDLGGSLSSDPAVSSWGPNRLDIFVEGDDNSVRHKAWNGTGWSDWETIGDGVDGTLAAVSRSDGTIDLFARGLNNELLHKTYS